MLPSDAAVDAIRVAILPCMERRLRLGPRLRDAGLLFGGPSGRPLNPSNLGNRDYHPRLPAARPVAHPPARLAPRFAAHLIRAGIDPRTVADVVGRASPRVHARDQRARRQRRAGASRGDY